MLVFSEEQRNFLSEAAGFRKGSWKTATITIPLEVGGQAKVKASVLRSWAVHSPIPGTRHAKFSRSPIITHIPTGLIFSRASSRNKAKAGIEAMIATEPKFINLSAEDVDKYRNTLHGWSRKILHNELD